MLARLLLATSLTATSLLLAPGAAACTSAAPAAVELPTLHVELAADRSVYRRGESATLRVTVTQAVADGPPVRDAVTEVDLSVGGRRVKRVGGSTAEDGRLALRFVVPRKAPAGRVKAVVTSRARLLVGAECDDLITGTGGATVDPLMTLRS